MCIRDRAYTYRKDTSSIQCIYRKYTVYIPQAYRIHTVNIPQTYRVYIVNVPYTYRIPTVYIPQTYRIPTSYILKTYRNIPYTKKLRIPYAYDTVYVFKIIRKSCIFENPSSNVSLMNVLSSLPELGRPSGCCICRF